HLCALAKGRHSAAAKMDALYERYERTVQTLEVDCRHHDQLLRNSSDAVHLRTSRAHTKTAKACEAPFVHGRSTFSVRIACQAGASCEEAGLAHYHQSTFEVS